MFAAPVSVAAAIGGHTHCEEANTQSYLQQRLFFVLSALMTVSVMWTHLCHSCVHGNHVHICRHKFQSGECKSLRSYMETTGTDPQLQTGNLSTQMITECEGICETGYLCTSSRTPPEERKKTSQPRDAEAINCAGCCGLSSCCGKAKISLASS